MTIEEKIEAALGGRVRSLVLSPPLPVAWPNNIVELPKPYLRVEYKNNVSERIAIKGSAPHRRLGILQITAVTPLNAGPAGATAIAGQIAEHFPADLIIDFDGISVRVEKAPDVLDAEKEAASWDRVISIRHECFA